MTQEETFGSPQNQSAQETKDQSLGKRIVGSNICNVQYFLEEILSILQYFLEEILSILQYFLEGILNILQYFLEEILNITYLFQSLILTNKIII